MCPERSAETLARPLVLSLRDRAMASDVSVTAHWDTSTEPPAGGTRKAMLMRAMEVFHAVEAACTRFDPHSPLMRANSEGGAWHEVPRECFLALCEAERAHRVTGGRFDPRVLGDLVRLGYDSNLRFTGQSARSLVELPPRERRLPVPPRPPWRLDTIASRHRVRIGPEPVDLGGIGKGLAVRWAAAELASSTDGFLVDAGGDIHCGGDAPGGGKWKVAVEDPIGDPDPVAVLALSDLACATSSTRLRRWREGGRTVHHLLDPRTGQPAGQGLASVTVVGPDPAMAEVWAKAMFVEGLDRAGRLAASEDLAALWVDVAGNAFLSSAMAPYICWSRVALG